MNAADRKPYVNRKAGIVIYREPGTGEFYASIRGHEGWIVLRATDRAEAIAEAKEMQSRAAEGNA